MVLSHMEAKVSLLELNENITEREAVEGLSFTLPTKNQYVLVACRIASTTQLLKQVHYR